MSGRLPAWPVLAGPTWRRCRIPNVPVAVLGVALARTAPSPRRAFASLTYESWRSARFAG